MTSNSYEAIAQAIAQTRAAEGNFADIMFDEVDGDNGVGVVIRIEVSDLDIVAYLKSNKE